MASGIEDKVWPLIADGKFKPVIDSTFALADAAAAHARIDDPDHIGKIVLVVDVLLEHSALLRSIWPTPNRFCLAPI